MCKILIVDDSQFARSVLKRPLAQEGYELFEAADGTQGLTAVQQHKPDCIITDMLMPEMDGIEFLRQLRSQGCVTPVIAVTADVQESTRESFEELGVSGFLSKPVRADRLLAAVHKAMASTQGATH